MGATGQKVRPWWKSRLGGTIVIVVGVASILGVVLWLTPPLCFGCTFGPQAHIASFGSGGWVSFRVDNPGNHSFTIGTVKGYEGSNMTYLGFVSLSSGNVVPAGQTFTMSAQFQGVSWQSGIRYTFDLVNTDGLEIPAFGAP